MAVQHQIFGIPRLLHIPTKRAAWSDRTALLMAEMCKLAYYKFEEGADGNDILQPNLDEVLNRLLAGEESAGSETLPDGEEGERPAALPIGAVNLRDDLAKAGFELAGLFHDKDTDGQAFLAVSKPANGADGGPEIRPFGEEAVVVLSFRGTDSVTDWITNINIIQRNVDGTPVHGGFQGAFDALKVAIQEQLKPLLEAGRTLYLTGHSLGGALALIATRELGSDSDGACYTFGSPRVGRYGFSRDIKTPMYRVVNANDLVPRLPPAVIPTILIWALRVMNVPAFGILKRLIGKIEKYVHYGDMRFLRRATAPLYRDLKVVANPSVIYRFFWYWPALFANQRLPWKTPIKDHDIDLYCAKLAAYSDIRNPTAG